MEAGPSFSHLNHLSSLQLLDVTELAGVADHFATLHIDNALRMRGFIKKKVYHAAGNNCSNSMSTPLQLHRHLTAIYNIMHV